MANRLMKMLDLGDRWLSQMLSAMLEFCPLGEESIAFFRASYLSRLPADIRGYLDSMETGFKGAGCLCRQAVGWVDF